MVVKCFQAHFRFRFSIFDGEACIRLWHAQTVVQSVQSILPVPESFLTAGAPKLTFSRANGANEDATNEDASLLRDGFRIPLDGVGIQVRFCGSRLAGIGSFVFESPKIFLFILKGVPIDLNFHFHKNLTCDYFSY